MLDADTASVGESALDVANLLVHLELRVRQVRLGEAAALAAVGAFLEGLQPADATLARVSAYSRATRLRLAGVYAFRPRWRGLAVDLFADALRPGAPLPGLG